MRFPRGVWLAAGALLAVLLAFGSRYGYHRDELYFLEAGRHPAWGYPDQPPLVPLLAAGWDVVVGGDLRLFRLLPALAVAALVLVAAATSAELGGGRRDQVGAAVVTALCAFVVAMGHLFSTSTFHLLLTSAAVLLLLRALRTGRRRDWLALGLVAGVAMQVQTLPAIVLACCLAGMLAVGPRSVLRTPGAWVAAVVAAAVAAPNLIWQAVHGWPQLEVAADIAAGGSTSSVERWQVIPFQLLIVGPLIAVVLVTGLLALARSPHLRPHRWLLVAYLTLLVVTTATGGKPYYADALIPAILAAGVPPLLDRTASSRGWTSFAAVVLLAHAAGTALISLPTAPPGSTAFAVAQAVNPDGGETVGWPQFVDTVRRQVADDRARDPGASSSLVVLTSNYGQAGALDQARRNGTAPALPPVYSGHNAYAAWGPPPGSATSALVVGWFAEGQLERWFTRCLPATEFRAVPDVDNEEQGVPIRVCTGPRRPWTDLWPDITHLG